MDFQVKMDQSCGSVINSIKGENTWESKQNVKQVYSEINGANYSVWVNTCVVYDTKHNQFVTLLWLLVTNGSMFIGISQSFWRLIEQNTHVVWYEYSTEFLSGSM